MEEEKLVIPEDLKWDYDEIYWPIFYKNIKEVSLDGTSFKINFKKIKINIEERLKELLIKGKILSYSVSEYDPNCSEDGGWQIVYIHPNYGERKSMIDLYTLLK